MHHKLIELKGHRGKVIYCAPKCTSMSEALAHAAASGVVLEDLVLRNQVISDVSLHGASLHDANLEGTRFVNVDLRNVSFHRCRLSKVQLEGCLLDGITLCGCTGTDFRIALRPHARGYLIEGEHVYKGVDMRDCRFFNASFGGIFAQAHLQDVHFIGGSLYNACFNYAFVHGTLFAGVELGYVTGSVFDWCSFSNIDLSGIRAYTCKISNCSIGKSCTIDWRSHGLVGQLLMSAAGGDVAKLQLACLVSGMTGWCWSNFARLDHPLKEWAVDVLAQAAVNGKQVSRLKHEITSIDLLEAIESAAEAIVRRKPTCRLKKPTNK